MRTVGANHTVMVGRARDLLQAGHSVGYIASVLGVSYQTVQRWLREGRLNERIAYGQTKSRRVKVVFPLFYTPMTKCNYDNMPMRFPYMCGVCHGCLGLVLPRPIIKPERNGKAKARDWVFQPHVKKRHRLSPNP